jgi:hypothetical protein
MSLLDNLCRFWITYVARARKNFRIFDFQKQRFQNRCFGFVFLSILWILQKEDHKSVFTEDIFMRKRESY